ncbi:MAG: ABC transporter substrate-binding protein [Gemmatimonadota bacterium]
MTNSPRALVGLPKRLLRSAAVLLVLFWAAACGDATDPDQPSPGGQAIIVEGADLDKPNPLVSESQLDNAVNAILYRPLLQPWWEDGQLLYLTADENPMALARSYEIFGADSASLRYNLRTDARWSDGQPITAHDAAWTIETRGRPEVASPRQDYNREIREVIVENDSTLVIVFNRPYPEIFFHTSGAVVPWHVYEGTDPAQMRSHPSLVNPAQELVTSGPFRLVGWTRGQQVVLQRSPDFEPQSLLERIVFRIIPEETTRMIELQTGNVDMAPVPFHFIPELRDDENLRIETQRSRSYEYIGYNPRAHDFLADPEIRRALGVALDVPGIIAALQMEEFAEPAGGPYPPIFRLLYDPEEQQPLGHDPEEAVRILADKGWVPGPDGILQNGGQRMSFSVLTNGENRRRVDVGQIVEQQWRRIGVEVQLQTLEFNTVIERSRQKEFEARIGGWGVGLSADLYQLWGDPELPFNDVSYDNPEVQRLFAIALEQPTEEEAAPYWREAASLIVADQPYTWLYYYDTPYAVNNRLQGTVVNTLGQYQQVWEWYIDE